MELKKYRKLELKTVLFVFGVLLLISIPNFALSIKRARDNSRKSDLGSITYALRDFHAQLGFLPMSTEDGRLIACVNKGEEPKIDKNGNLVYNFIPCNWGESSIIDPRDEKRVFLEKLPTDPRSKDGFSYLYIGNGNRYQLMVHLEAVDDDEFNVAVEKRNLKCGNQICNTGRAFGSTPVDISIEEYEKTLPN